MQVEGTAETVEATPAPAPEPGNEPETTPEVEPVTPVEEPTSPEAKPETVPAATPEAPKPPPEDLVREALTPAGYDPEEFLAPRAELAEEKQRWGNNWPIRDLAMNASTAIVEGSFEEKLDAFVAVSESGTFEFINDVLEAQGHDHVALKHGISPQELDRRIGPPESVKIPRDVERALEQLPEEQAKVITDVIAQRNELKRRLDDAIGVAKQAQAKVVEISRTNTTNAFGQEFVSWEQAAISRLADVPPEALRSVLVSVYDLLKADPAAAAAFTRYEAEVEKGQNPRVLHATFLPPVLAAAEACIKHELFKVRGYKPKPGTENGSAKPAGTPSKVINPTKAADAAATAAKTKAPSGERKIPTSAEVADAIIAERAAKMAAQQKGA